MSKLLKKLTRFAPFKKFLSSASIFGLGYKMVRFFPNPYDDYKPGAALALIVEEVAEEINEHIKSIEKRFPPSPNKVDGGLYVGVTGIAYMFYHLSKNSLLSQHRQEYLERGVEYIKPALEISAGEPTSFLLGDAGTFAISAALLKEASNEAYIDSLKKFKSLYGNYLNPQFLKCGADEFFVGRAGYLAGVLWLRRELETPVFSDEELYKICDVIVKSGRDYSKSKNSPSPLMYHYYKTEYLGAAHGVSFILQILLSVPGYLQHNPSAAKDIAGTLHFLASTQSPDGNWPCCMEELGMTDHKLVHWCHGAPGMIYSMAKAYLVFKDQKFLDACIRAGEVIWNRGLLHKGPGICHGVAGNGYAFLLLYRLTGDNKYLYRAKVFAEFMNTDEFLRDARVPDNPETLYEGTAGTVCYLADLIVPDKAEFPFQDVFSSYNY